MKPTICLPFCVTLILICLNAVTSQHSSSCCLKTNNNKIHMRRVKDYRIQKAGICPIDAIVLMTVKGKEKCFDPKSDWAKNVMKTVDERKTRTTQNPKASPDQRQKKNGRKGRKQRKNKKT
ncbi:C-C motif chemokine 32b.3 [Paramisgurnus dabryanus]|uniref:C-C motif chemokine 32b.3 n=1 Tax=Paramisgurnus dabryanus TaxID=90735 RepID=UPI0031F43FC4